MIHTPVLKAHLHVEVIHGGGVSIQSDHAIKTLRRGACEKIVPLMDGQRTTDEIVDALAGQVDAAKVYYVLNGLEAKGYLTEATPDIPAPMSDFVSPLRIRRNAAFAGIRFGVPAMPPEILALRADLEVRLHAVLTRLPTPMRAEGSAIIDAYSARAGEFYGLFYLPVWSFLHWIPASADIALDPALVDDARTAQALGLFLHLWDDHLCDGQLSIDLLRIQIRTEAWQTYLAACRRLCERIAPESGLVEEHVATYLAAIHLKEPVTDIAAYCSRFTLQIAIWTLVPKLLGQAGGGPSGAADLSQIVDAFSNAWRLIDDVQDVEDDIRAGVESAVWQCLDKDGRAAWTECRSRSRSLAQGGLEPQSWKNLLKLIRAQGCIPRLLALTHERLNEAARLAERHQWRGLAREILESQSGLIFPG